MVVVAPTGVAAINAGGVTIHSFFQLPFGPFVPGAGGFEQNDAATDKHSLLGRLRLNSERKRIIQELELLIIDEISMVRCDVLDAIDLVLRHVRYRHSEKFGGVQVLFIGDMFQLPPVVKEEEWSLLRDYYQSPYFFDSHVIKDHSPVCIEFTRIYRQTEEKFIHLLNKIRNNEMSEEDFVALHNRYQPEFFGDGSEGYILLTTHNEKARQINSDKLAKLPGKLLTYKAEVERDFPATAFPAEEQLQLKVGAQVMFIKNDADKAKRYFNGKIGVISNLSGEKIVVQCKNERSSIEVGKEKWENIRYTLDKSTRQLNEEVLGSFSQYPLRLAWAITIHKSQGLSFEKAVIDAGKAFAAGQVYVALSRCTSLDGMVLHSKIRPDALYADSRILQFAKNTRSAEALQDELTKAKKMYQENLIVSLFDFRKTVNGIKELKQFLLDHTASFNAEALPWIDELLNRLLTLQTTGEKFHGQLRKLFAFTEMAEDNGQLQERIRKAATWFISEIKSLIEAVLHAQVSTESKVHAKEFNEQLREAYAQLTNRSFMLEGFSGEFTMENFHRRSKSFIVPSFGVNAYTAASERKAEFSHPGLYYQLKKLRDGICARTNQPFYLVAGSKALEEMTSYLPQTLDELEQISGFGKTKVEAYGNEFLQIIKAYSKEKGLSSAVSQKSPRRKRKEAKGSRMDTKAETFKLYQEGKTVSEIAAQRNLTTQTIEGHLFHFVQKGMIRVEQLVSREKIVLIEPAVINFTGGSITAIKEKLGDTVSFADIRLVLASVQHKNSSSHVNHQDLDIAGVDP